MRVDEEEGKRLEAISARNRASKNHFVGANEMVIDFTVPGKPVAQSRPRFARRGNFVATYDAAPSKDYKSWVKWCAVQAMDGRARFPREMALSLDVVVTTVKPKSLPKHVIHNTKKPDIDNYVKGLMDAMEGVVYEADQQIVEIHARKVYGESDMVSVSVTGQALEWAREGIQR